MRTGFKPETWTNNLHYTTLKVPEKGTNIYKPILHTDSESISRFCSVSSISVQMAVKMA